MKRDISVIVPTYNEKDNVTPLLERLDKALKGRNYEVLFVDDNSKDGTAELARNLSKKYPVNVIVRKDKRGLASAVADGFKAANGKTLIVMDADLQHPPEVVPSIVKAVEDGADIAIASRYVKGGGCENWSTTRKIISRVATILARVLLPPARKVCDPMSGFFGLKRQVVEKADLQPIGYKILLETLGQGEFKKVAEVPFVFKIRERGASKLNSKQQIDYLKHIYSLLKRGGELKRFIKFCIVGASGVGVNLGLYWLLTRFGSFEPLDKGAAGNILSGNLALTISIETSIITNFILNNFFTFADRNASGIGSFLGRLLKFNLVSLVGALIQIGVTNLLVLGLGLYDLISLLIAVIIAMLWNFLANSLWTWGRR
jgi:dolichol-phosphate mannosyltransferase